MPRHCYVLRVFTRGDEGGNHLGVVTDATSLTTASMQAIAVDLGFSETIFLEWREGEIPYVRIFTPGAELPFAGHPLVGMAWTLKTLGPGGPDTLRCEAFEVAIRLDGELTAIEVPLGQTVRPVPEAASLAAAVGLPEPVSARWVDMPLPYLLIEVASAAAVSAAEPASEAEFARAGADMVYLYAFASPSVVQARFFAPGHGVFEDPATGSAAVALSAALRAEGRASGRLEIRQGSEIGHPSSINLEWHGAQASIGGTVRKDEVRWLDI
ncbi:MAG: PhzF family phenazine biosynthesis isomerase [Acidimicrobiia bacterium]|nr:PhzF family phenazine biosynthesis isomerase [Acidimicrobiia bacterium]MDH3397409.1 PhzF family phenazine biosynthesis isomerase [Acidimicrobiia bacterium]